MLYFKNDVLSNKVFTAFEWNSRMFGNISDIEI